MRLRLEALEDRVVPALVGLVADDGSNSATVFDPNTNTALGSVSLPNPLGAMGDVLIANNGTLGFVTNFNNQVLVLDLSNPSAPTLASGTNSIPIANPGEDLAITPDQQYLLVSDGSGTEPLSVVSIASRSQVGTFNLGSDVNSVDVSSSGSVLVTSFNANDLRRLTIDSSGTLTDTGESMSVSGPMNVNAAPGGVSGVVVSSNGFVESFLISGLTPVDTRSISGQVISAVFDPAGDKVYVRSASGTVTAFGFNAATGQLSASPLFTISVSTANTFFGMDQLTISQDGSELYVPDDNANTIDVFDASNGSQLATISDPSISDPTGITIPIAEGAPTTVTAQNASATFSTHNQSLSFSANLTSKTTVDEGTVTFTVEDSKGNTIGNPVQGTASGGTASADFTLPANTPAGTYAIVPSYFDSGGKFYDNSNSNGTLIIVPATVTTTAVNATAVYSPNKQIVGLTATVADGSFPGDTVREGTVTFTVKNGSTTIGTASGAVGATGSATATFFVPAGQGVGTYTIDVSYSDSNGNFVDSGDTGSQFTITPAYVVTTANKTSAAYSVGPQTVTLSADLADQSNSFDTVSEGAVTFTIMQGTTSLGSAQGNVSNGAANANFTLPAGLVPGSYTIDVQYKDASGNFLDNGDTGSMLTIVSAKAATAAVADSTIFHVGARNVTLTADVTSPAGIVNEGEVTFTVMQGKTVIGTATTSGTVSNGQASVSYALPAGLAAGGYIIQVSYSDSSGNFIDGGDQSAALAIAPAKVSTTAVNAAPSYNTNPQSVTLNALVADLSYSSDTVDEGQVLFTVLDGSTPIGSTSGTVSGGTASAVFNLPAGQSAGSYLIQVSYSDKNGNFVDGGDTGGVLTVAPASVTVTAATPSSVVYSSNAQSMTLSAAVANTTFPSDIVNEGSVVFTVMKGKSAIQSIAGSVSNGTASADFTLPAGAVAGNYTIAVHYTDSPGNYLDSGDTNATLTVSAAGVGVTANDSTATYSPSAQTLLLSAGVANTSNPSETVNNGVVTFAIENGGTTIGSVQAAVNNGSAKASFLLPAGQAAGSYTIAVGYSDAQGNFAETSNTNGTLTISPVSVTTAANGLLASYSPNTQSLALSATVANVNVPSESVDQGIVTFTVVNGGNSLGTAQGSVSDGTATAIFILPAAQAIGSYIIQVGYINSTGNYIDSGDTDATLTVQPAHVTTTANAATTVYSTHTQTLALSAAVADASIATDTVNEGVVTFTVTNGSKVLGTAQATVSGGKANTGFTLPAEQAAGSYTIAVSYSDDNGNFTDSGDTSALLTVSPAQVTATAGSVSAVYSTNTQTVNLSASVLDTSIGTDTVNAGAVTFTLTQGKTTLGSALGMVSSGTANAVLTVPAGLAPGSYTVAVGYSDSQGNFTDGGSPSAPLTIGTANVGTEVDSTTAAYSPNAQTVTLSANVVNASIPSDTVNEGTVAFTVLDGGAVVSSGQGTVSGGKASANVTLPAGLVPGNYTLEGSYSDDQGNFVDYISATGNLTVSSAGVTTTAADANTLFRSVSQTVTLSAAVVNPAEPNNAIGEGVVTFTVLRGNTVFASTVGAVTNGTASADVLLPAALAAGNYTLAVRYSDSQASFADSGDTNAVLTIHAATTTAQLTQVSLAPNYGNLTATETLTAHIGSSSPVAQGTVTFYLSNEAVTANVDGNGNAVAVVTLPMLTLLGPQDISVNYSDAAGNRIASTDLQTAAWRIFNPILQSTATFSPNSDSVTADLFGLFITYTNGVLTEIDYGSFHLVFAYNAGGQLDQVNLNGMDLL